MAKDTDISLRNKVIYCLYVRNHTEEGTFKAVEDDLRRIRDLGVDIIWLMPINPIGKVSRKGSLGCPYSVQDYREVNPQYGTMSDFKHLVSEIHRLGMKCIIDIVYNHTSRDSYLSKSHPEYFFKDKEGKMANRIGEWSDVYDLDYSNKELWDYQIDTLKGWLSIVDGFRCDVASLVPLEFWEKARLECDSVKGYPIWLAESVHSLMIHSVRKAGIKAWSDGELYNAFDITYDYDIWDYYDRYLDNDISLKQYVDILNLQDSIYPENYIKLRCLENHDQPRIASRVKSRNELINWTAFLYFQKGITLIYGGQEFEDTNVPSLFDKDILKRNDNEEMSLLMKELGKIKRTEIFTKGAYELKDVGSDVIVGTYEFKGETILGLFSLKGKSAEVSVDLQDGQYLNKIDGSTFNIINGKANTEEMPAIISI